MLWLVLGVILLVIAIAGGAILTRSSSLWDRRSVPVYRWALIAGVAHCRFVWG